MRFQREVARIQKLYRRIGIIPPEGFPAGRNEIRIALTPYRKQRRLCFSEIFLESGIDFQIVGVVEKQVQLNVRVPGPRHQRGIKGITFGRNQVRICISRFRAASVYLGLEPLRVNVVGDRMP